MTSEVTLITVYTDRARLERLERSCDLFGFPLLAVKPRRWTGKCSKVEGALEALLNLPSTALVVFADAYDSAVVAPPNQVASSFRSAEAAVGRGCVLFQAERNCWPDDHLRPVYDDRDRAREAEPWRYLNSGGFAGLACDVRKLLEANPIGEEPDDQRHFTRVYLKAQPADDPPIVLDRSCRLFQSLFCSRDDVDFGGTRVSNTYTGSCPCIVHGNGSAPMDRVDAWLAARATRQQGWPATE